MNPRTAFTVSMICLAVSCLAALLIDHLLS